VECDELGYDYENNRKRRPRYGRSRTSKSAILLLLRRITSKYNNIFVIDCLLQNIDITAAAAAAAAYYCF
jgi:hypothetical protein